MFHAILAQIKAFRGEDGDEILEKVSDSWLLPAAYVTGLLLLPIVLPTGLAVEIMIFGVFAMSFNILFGFAGLLTFGHALFFGTGAYFAGYITIHMGYPLLAVLAIVIVVQILLAFVVGALSLRLTDVYFAIITLAFAQFAYELTFALDEYTGGDDGLIGITRPDLIGLDLIDMTDSMVFTYLVVAVAIVLGLFIYRLSNSLFGRTLRSIKENEDRTESLGVHIYPVKLTAFIVAGVIAAITGVLWVYFIRFVSPSVLYWTVSGDAVLFTVIGGMNSIFGPLLGAFLLEYLDDTIFHAQPGYLNVTIGTLLILVVLFFRNGVAGMLRNSAARIIDAVMGDSD